MISVLECFYRNRTLNILFLKFFFINQPISINRKASCELVKPRTSPLFLASCWTLKWAKASLQGLSHVSGVHRVVEKTRL